MIFLRSTGDLVEDERERHRVLPSPLLDSRDCRGLPWMTAKNMPPNPHMPSGCKSGEEANAPTDE